MSEEALRSRLQRMQQRIDLLEGIVEDRSREVFVINEKLRATAEFLDQVYKAMSGALIVFGQNGLIEAINDAAIALLEYTQGELIGRPASTIFEPAEDEKRVFEDVVALAARGATLRTEKTYKSKSGTLIPVLLSASLLGGGRSTQDEPGKVVCVAMDITERKRLESELRHAQKLESVGQLAAGIAHEINTPIQFVGDNVRFLRDAFSDLTRLMDAYALADGSPEPEAMLARARELAAEVDVAFLAAEVPEAIGQTLEGVQRVATIVRAMKAFGHPSGEDKALADLNEAVCNTLAVASNELKYVAEVVTDLGELPPVWCHLGDINQVLLNLVVNAAHALADKVGESGERGTVTVRTRREGDEVIIEVSDTGVGIPPEVADRIFEPFFTTKEVGKGTGQGLALAYSLVVDRHGGYIGFDSLPGAGTTMTVRLPITVPDRKPFAETTASATTRAIAS